MDQTKIVDFGVGKGRGLVATKEISPGDTILTETPLVLCQFSYNKKYKYAACDFCLRPLESAEENARRLSNDLSIKLPYATACPLFNFPKYEFSEVVCAECSTRFCSPHCLLMAQKLYHSVMCQKEAVNDENEPLNHLESIWCSMHYPPETSTVMILVRIAAIHFSAFYGHCVEAKEIVLALSGFVCGLTMDHVESSSPGLVLAHKLLGEKFSDQLNLLYPAFVDAITYLAKKVAPGLNPQDVLKEVGLISFTTCDGFCSALSLLGRNGQGIATSSLSQWAKRAEAAFESECLAEPVEKVASSGSGACAPFQIFLDELYAKIDKHVGAFLDNEGVGLYRYQSLVNHSCEPNSEVNFSGAGAELRLVALRHLVPGDELTISYLDACQLTRSRHSRRRYLAENYLFLCDCSMCQRQALPDGEVSQTSSEDEEDDEEENGSDVEGRGDEVME